MLDKQRVTVTSFFFDFRVWSAAAPAKINERTGPNTRGADNASSRRTGAAGHAALCGRTASSFRREDDFRPSELATMLRPSFLLPPPLICGEMTHSRRQVGMAARRLPVYFVNELSESSVISDK